LAGYRQNFAWKPLVGERLHARQTIYTIQPNKVRPDSRISIPPGVETLALPKHLLPTTVVGSYPQPDWLVDRQMLSKSVP
jgi:5-methyltetrahydropteroyltriglutamate--homocysteine methyltransferase